MEIKPYIVWAKTGLETLVNYSRYSLFRTLVFKVLVEEI
jgi:hypothetical protein